MPEYIFKMLVSVALDNTHPNFTNTICHWYNDRCQNFIGEQIETYSIIPFEGNIFSVKITTKKSLNNYQLELLKEELCDPDSIEKYHIRWQSVYGIAVS